MNRLIRVFTIAWIGMVLAIPSGCISSMGRNLDNNRSPDNTIQLFAASSTTDAVRTIRSAFSEATGYEIELTLGGSSTLANQIIQGAPADIFLSANEDWCDEVARQSSENRCEKKVLLGNRLVIIVHKDSEVTQLEHEDLSSQLGLVAVANTESVPAGIYTKQALQQLSLWDQLAPQLIPSNNVRAALQYVETESVPFGIVYATDAVASSHVRVIYEFDPDLHEQIRYPLLRLGDSGHPAKDSFYEFLQGKQAAKIFQQHGFSLFVSEVN